MRLADVGAFAAASLAANLRRTALSLLGVAIGICAVVVLTGLGEGARRYVTAQFQDLGTNLLIAIPGRTETTGALPGIGGAPNDLTLADAQALERSMPQALHVVPLAMGNEAVDHAGRSRRTVVLGSTAPLLTVRNLGVARGRFLPEAEMDRGSQVAVLGEKVAKELFGDANPLTETVRVGGFRMQVIGVMESRGVQLGFDMDDVVIVPVATAMQMFNRASLFRILIQLRGHEAVEPAKDQVLAFLAERHGEEDVTCFTQDAIVTALSGILTALTAALAGIAAVSLTVAGIGIMNVMLVSVAERVREVGLLVALGARRRQVLALFLCEAVVLSALGGALGLAIGWVAVRVLAVFLPALPAATPAWAVGAAAGVSLLTGVLSGILPAVRAARLDPTVALRKG